MYTRNRQIFVYKTSVLEFLGGVKTELKKLETICWHYSDLVVSKNVKLKVTSSKLTKSVAEFKEFKRRFKFSAGLNIETFNTILSGINYI